MISSPSTSPEIWIVENPPVQTSEHSGFSTDHRDDMSDVFEELHMKENFMGIPYTELVKDLFKMPEFENESSANPVIIQNCHSLSENDSLNDKDSNNSANNFILEESINPEPPVNPTHCQTIIQNNHSLSQNDSLNDQALTNSANNYILGESIIDPEPPVNPTHCQASGRLQYQISPSLPTESFKIESSLESIESFPQTAGNVELVALNFGEHHQLKESDTEGILQNEASVNPPKTLEDIIKSAVFGEQTAPLYAETNKIVTINNVKNPRKLITTEQTKNKKGKMMPANSLPERKKKKMVPKTDKPILKIHVKPALHKKSKTEKPASERRIIQGTRDFSRMFNTHPRNTFSPVNRESAVLNRSINSEEQASEMIFDLQATADGLDSSVSLK